MAVAEEMQKKMLVSIEEKTGRKPAELIEIIRKQNFEKHGEKLKFAKTEFGLTHGFANLLAHLSKAEPETVPGDPIEILFSGKEKLKSWYDQIMGRISSWEGLETAPKKTYVSLRTEKQFAILQPSTKSRLDIGLNLKGMDAEIENAGSWNAMVSHRIRVERDEDLDDEVIKYLKTAYEISRK